MNLTNERIEQILAGAPDGATHYYDGHYYILGIGGSYPTRIYKNLKKTLIDCAGYFHALSDLREILTLRQRIEQLEAEMEIHKRHTELVDSLTHYMVKRGIGTLGQYSTTEIVRVYEELEAQQSEVAARAYEKGAGDACECVNEGMSLDEIEEWAEEAGKSYANQLRKGESK